MNRVKGPARLGFAAALLALLLAPLALGFHTANAQAVDKATYYGAGLEAGATVAASVDGTECSSTTVADNGEWVLEVSATDACEPEDGDTVNFSIDGNAANETETWEPGGTPADLTNGVSLTAAAMDGGMEGGEEGGMEGAPEPGEPGQAGLVSSSSSSSLLVLALGILAVAGIAGARVSTRRVS